jgi:DivIVA domain-containing protein
MAVKLFLNSQTIMNHVFPIVGKNAYDATEVDKFLDSIIQDYKKVEENTLVLKKEYEDLTSKNRSLEQEKRKLEVELEKYKARFANIKSSDNVTNDNIELVRRINSLEKFLWAHGFNPDTIKK